eukprot:SAG22_NODE_164_length_16817_cov_61.573573_21_plen_126_part_00
MPGIFDDRLMPPSRSLLSPSLPPALPACPRVFLSYWMRPDGVTLKPLIMHKDISPWRDLPSEPQSVARQILPGIFWHNAYIDIVRYVSMTLYCASTCAAPAVLPCRSCCNVATEAAAALDARTTV